MEIFICFFNFVIKETNLIKKSKLCYYWILNGDPLNKSWWKDYIEQI